MNSTHENLTPSAATSPSYSSYRVIGRLVTNREQPIEWNDTLVYLRKMPNGSVIWPGEVACNYEGCIGLPAGVLIDVGFYVYDQWLCEVRDRKVVRAIVRILGPACALEERPGDKAARPYSASTEGPATKKSQITPQR